MRMWAWAFGSWINSRPSPLLAPTPTGAATVLMLLLMPAITCTKTLSANAQALPRAYPTSHMLSLCVLGSQPQHCTCQVMRRTHGRALLKRSSNCVVRQLGPGPGSRTAACHTSDPSAAPPPFPLLRLATRIFVLVRMEAGFRSAHPPGMHGFNYA
jgi:hypothetical protein